MTALAIAGGTAMLALAAFALAGVLMFAPRWLRPLQSAIALTGILAVIVTVASGFVGLIELAIGVFS